MPLLSKNIIAKLKELDQAQHRLMQAVVRNTKACLFEQQEELHEKYYMRRSDVLMKIQLDHDENDILNSISYAIGLTMGEVDTWEKTKIKK
jgi:hypothetical protein